MLLDSAQLSSSEAPLARIEFAIVVTVLLLAAASDAPASDGAKAWYLMEPPVDDTSDVGFGILIDAPLTRWNRIATFGAEAACEARRDEAVQASREETLRLSRTSPLPKLEVFKGAYRDSGLARSSICVSADDPRLASGLTR